jgi:hypothetical protein
LILIISARPINTLLKARLPGGEHATCFQGGIALIQGGGHRIGIAGGGRFGHRPAGIGGTLGLSTHILVQPADFVPHTLDIHLLQARFDSPEFRFKLRIPRAEFFKLAERAVLAFTLANATIRTTAALLIKVGAVGLIFVQPSVCTFVSARINALWLIIDDELGRIGAAGRLSCVLLVTAVCWAVIARQLDVVIGAEVAQ